MNRTRSLRLCAVSLAVSTVLAACGGSSGSKSDASAGSNGSAGADSSTPTAAASDAGAPAANPFPTPSAYPQGSKAVSGMPAITANATTLDKEPTIAKGTGPAPTNLMIRDLVVGTGKAASPSDTVNVRYVGALYSDGTVFDASWNRGSGPTAFPLSGVVPGFAGGIVGMKIGGRREIVIPSYMGYGGAGSGPVPPNATLVFVVDLVSLG